MHLDPTGGSGDLLPSILLPPPLDEAHSDSAHLGQLVSTPPGLVSKSIIFSAIFRYVILPRASTSGFFSPVLRFQEQQNFRNLEFRREILEFSKRSFHFHGGNLEFPLSLEEKSCFFCEKPLSLENLLSLDCL